jgi:hypothetical protein
VDSRFTDHKAKGYVNGRNHPLEEDYGHHDPWGPILLLDKNIAADPAKGKVYA